MLLQPQDRWSQGSSTLSTEATSAPAFSPSPPAPLTAHLTGILPISLARLLVSKVFKRFWCLLIMHLEISLMLRGELQ